MKRHSDNNDFVDDAHDISTSRSLGCHSPSLAISNSQTLVSHTRDVYHTKTRDPTGWNRRSSTFLLPALGDMADFDFDFQSNVPYSQVHLSPASQGLASGQCSNSLGTGLSSLGVQCDSVYSVGTNGTLTTATSSSSYSCMNVERARVRMTTHTRLDASLCLTQSNSGLVSPGGTAYSDDSSHENRRYSYFSSPSLPSLLGSTSEDYLSDGSRPSRNGTLDSFLDFTAQDDSDDTEGPPIGLIADVNMRQIALKDKTPIMGVSLVDIEGPLSFSHSGEVSSPVVEGSEDLQYPLFPESAGDACSESTNQEVEFSQEHITAIVSVLAAGIKEEDPNENNWGRSAVANAPPTAYVAPHLGMKYPYWLPGMPLNVMHSPYPYAQTGLVPQEHPYHDHATKMRVHESPSDFQPTSQSPVKNAHRGIPLQELRCRADDFRRQNPGYELDKNWLQDYAGRLTPEGELMEDYRCYVVGCTQKNKRRDHILVHVGSHVEHRPFQCGICDMRFLRKNECKRHESSHTGDKPFSCPVCGEDKSFVRQDLLKRHLRVAHGLESSRKRARLSDAEEAYWP